MKERKKFTWIQIIKIITAIFITITLTVILIAYLAYCYTNKNVEITGIMWAITSINTIMIFLDNIFPKEKSNESKQLEEIKAELQNINSKMILVKVNEVIEETSNNSIL